MNILKTIESHQSRQNRITGIMAELDTALQVGTAEHFISWHNSKATASNRISSSWYEQYLKECDEKQ